MLPIDLVERVSPYISLVDVVAGEYVLYNFLVDAFVDLLNSCLEYTYVSFVG